MKVLIVVDMQNDFITGSLGTKEAQAIVPKVVDKIKNWDGERVIYTYDSHYDNYLSTQEGKKLPVKHCIYKTEGWKIEPTVRKALEDYNGNIYTEQYYLKDGFGSVQLAKDLLDLQNKSGDIESITLIGLCTGICVISNAILLKSFLPEVPIIVDKDCCACVTPESHKRAIEAMKLLQVEIE